VPVPVAGAGGVTSGGVETLDVLAADDEAVESDDVLPFCCCSALWIAAVSAVLVRLSAVWLAMLDNPFDSVVEAPNMLLMKAELKACWPESDCAFAQKFWSCCQNETLPTLLIALAALDAPSTP
jgi:hypothetical protein